MKIKTLLFSSVTIFTLASCNHSDYQEHNNLDMRTYLDGKNAYAANCSSCHGKNGEGFNNLYPALNNNKLYTEKKTEIPCVIFYGRKGNVIMPSFKNLNNETILAITNYLMEEHQSEGKKDFYTLKSIEEKLKKCTSN